MKQEVITGKELKEIGFPQSVAIAVAMECARNHYRPEGKNEALENLKQVLANPAEFRSHGIFAPVADVLCREAEETVIALKEPVAYTTYGSDFIEAGAGYHGRFKADHAVLEHPVFRAVESAKKLQDKACSQLGTSGGGNHFVEWGIIEMLSDENELDIPKGKYLALLSHSGSRGLGAMLANHYTRLAKQVCRLPKEAVNLAYLDLNTEEGQEYWLAMNLAGDYASACHEVIHNRLTEAIGGQLLGRVVNHHNFAWKETWQGEEVVVHRKGATPAGEGVMGIIPGSMTAPGFLVRGKGKTEAIHSASHGAGRQMSRTRAEQTFSREDLRTILNDHGVTLIGGGLDEAPGAYKDIHQVMAAQQELVEVLARFTPKMVRMAEDGSRED